jgi:hypothetical protein
MRQCGVVGETSSEAVGPCDDSHDNSTLKLMSVMQFRETGYVEYYGVMGSSLTTKSDSRRSRLGAEGQAVRSVWGLR